MITHTLLICAIILPSLSAQNAPPSADDLNFARMKAMVEEANADGAGEAIKPGKEKTAQKAKATQDQAKKRRLDQQRTELLKRLKIDRSTSGILEARLEAKRLAERNDENSPKTKPEGTQTPIQAETNALKEDIKTLQRNVSLGAWNDVKGYLEKLPDAQAKTTFSRIVQLLAAPIRIQPRPELTVMGAQAHTQQQYLRPTEILALTDASKKAPDNATLAQIAKLMTGAEKMPTAFMEALKNGTRYLGLKDEKSKIRTANLLITASYLDEATQFLPDLALAQKEKNHAAINIIARYHTEAHSANQGKEHLPLAWKLSLSIISDKEAPTTEKSEALYRALAIVPDLEGSTGRDWLTKTFVGASKEGFEILAAVGTLTAQTREHRSPQFRLQQLKLQNAAAAALLGNDQIDLSLWQEILTLYVRNWNAEAARSFSLDTAKSMRPQANFDSFGNVYYSRPRSAPTSARQAPAIDSGELLHIIPTSKWIAAIDEPVRLEHLAQSASLFLKVKEEAKAFPILKQLSLFRPDRAKALVKNMITVWAENNNPNQQSRHRSAYSFYSGYNQRAETIPLTRSKQERNLKQLAKLISKVRTLELDDDFSDEFADAFIQAHSKAEVWRLEALEAVFGPTHNLDPATIASLLTRMRANLANLWPDPRVQTEAKTKRKDKELEAQILRGYAAAKTLCDSSLDKNPDNWTLQLQGASLIYEESNYRAKISTHPEHSANKRKALDALAIAAQTYTATLPLEDKKNESTTPFTTWFYAALGSPDLGALRAVHQPIPSELPKIKAALNAIPKECHARHLEAFSRTLNARLANVTPDLKHRFLESALPITGQHPRIEESAKIFEYYQDLITEISLDVRIDGPDQIDASQPFGLFVNLRHTKEIERESGGFQRYLINQNNSVNSYNYGRPTEDYRDKFETAARATLEEHFEVISVTFHSSKVRSRTDPEPGWTVTPYAYFLLKPKGPEIDTIPPLKIDLDFLDTSGYVVLPVSSAAIPIDATKGSDARPFRDLTLTMILDERESEESNKVSLDIRANAHGIIPPLDQLVKLPLSGLKITETEDRELQIEELDAETDDGAPLSTHEYRITFEPEGDNLPKEFTFPEVLVPVSQKENEGLILQKYNDVDLVSVEAKTEILAGSDSKSSTWIGIILLLIAAAVVLYLLLKKKPEEEVISGPSLPSTLTPITLLNFLENLKNNATFSDSEDSELGDAISTLKDRSFGPKATPPNDEELQEIGTRWQQVATQKAAA